MDVVVMMMMVMRRGKSGGREEESEGEDNELLHGDQNGTNGCRLSCEIGLRIKEATAAGLL